MSAPAPAPVPFSLTIPLDQMWAMRTWEEPRIRAYLDNLVATQKKDPSFSIAGLRGEIKKLTYLHNCLTTHKDDNDYWNEAGAHFGCASVADIRTGQMMPPGAMFMTKVMQTLTDPVKAALPVDLERKRALLATLRGLIVQVQRLKGRRPCTEGPHEATHRCPQCEADFCEAHYDEAHALRIYRVHPKQALA